MDNRKEGEVFVILSFRGLSFYTIVTYKLNFFA